ncbi:MAG: site-2 protease family protein [Pseudomonadales bacterium]
MSSKQEVGAQRTELLGSRLTSLFGIEIHLHISVIIIFALIVTGLGRGVLPQWHPDWSMLACWIAATIAGVLFFCSLLAHEMSHALVARSRGIQTKRITLFLFGGVAAIEAEPRNPKDELLIAAAGPLMSLALSLLFGLLVVLIDGPAIDVNASEPSSIVASLSGAGTVAIWLSTVNLMLALFNLIPGFPMDGGRLFRAALWWRSGDMVWATRQASKGGRLFGWFLIFSGMWMLLGGATIDGIWLILIGWFIDHLAKISVTQLLLDQALEHTTVSAIMRTHFDKVPNNISAESFIADYVLRSRQQTWPIEAKDADLGYLTIDSLPSERDPQRLKAMQIVDYMTPLDEANALAPSTNARTAQRLILQRKDPLPVLDQGRVVGLVDQLDILRWFDHLARTRESTS